LFFVELAGIEPASGQETEMVSTCLALVRNFGNSMVKSKTFTFS